jgi:hypothetical protein
MLSRIGCNPQYREPATEFMGKAVMQERERPRQNRKLPGPFVNDSQSTSLAGAGAYVRGRQRVHPERVRVARTRRL